MIRLTTVLILACTVLPQASLHSQKAPPPSSRDRTRLEEVSRLVRRGQRIWSGWEHTPFAVLLVTDSVEYLVGHPRPSPDFARTGHDSLLGTVIRTRPRVF